MIDVTFRDVHEGWVTINHDVPFDFMVDIDGTIANNTHRSHYIASKPKNWPAYEAGILRDEPIMHILLGVKKMIEAGCRAIMCSGRGDHQRGDTEWWLKYVAGVSYEKLYMRSAGDYRCDSIIKWELYQQIKQDGYKPCFVLDDRNRVVEMWRKHGVQCIQVAEGDF